MEEGIKKYISLVIVFGFIIFSPPKLISSVFYIKLSLGLSYGGNINDLWTNTTNYFIQGTEKDAKKHSTVNGFCEFVFPVHQNFNLSVGAGYISKGLNGSRGIFAFPNTSGFTGDFVITPEFHFQSFPVLFTALWTYPVWLEARLYILGGFGYYFSKFNIYSYNITYNLQDPLSTLNYFPTDFRGKANSIGYHAGAGYEIDIERNVSFFIESFYRRVNFKKFKKDFGIDKESPVYAMIREQLGESATESVFLYFINWGEDEDWGDIIYTISNIVLSEFIIRVGFRIGF